MCSDVRRISKGFEFLERDDLKNEYPEHREPWRSLLIDPYNSHAAEARFRDLVGIRNELPGVDPRNPLADPIGVKFEMPDRMVHVLYKDKFQEDRARRICWIKHGLVNPGRLYWKEGNGTTIHHYYACDVSEAEEFVIIVDQYTQTLFRFATMIPYAKARWTDLKRNLRRGPPVKREGPPENDP